jgi:serine/threonine-protein kinase
MMRRDETPRDLLFGLLALQIGLIDQDQLVAAFGAWSRAKGKTLAEILFERGSIDAESRALLTAMAEKQLRLHGGNTEKSLAAVTAGPSTREKLSALGDGDLTSSLALVGPDRSSADATATTSFGSATSDGQRFRILRPHAKGGLGAVFVALDGELNREVALKQILDSHADDEASRRRFLLEAEITGGLEHPGIVPVYGLGTYGDGRPYYAMRFIRGDSLREAIERFHADASLKSDPGRRSLELRKHLRRFTDICNAIDYAHSRGVLHRDIKPGNVIIGKHGETLIVDWGLAKALGEGEAGSPSDERTLIPSSASGSAETLPGSTLGTPAYMSPEQAAGDLDRLGVRSDVYSLGATLYCLLTGKAPFDGDVGEVLRGVQRGGFPPPRQLDSTVDQSLQAVCLKAMATRPEDRYPSCHALADEVDRWMADEPVSARPDRRIQKLARWSRRHRPLTWSAAAALAVLAVTSTTATIFVNGARGRERAALARAEVNLERANANFLLARQAVDDYFTRVSQNTLLKVQSSRDLRELRKGLLEDALKFYRAFIDRRGDDPALRRELARAYARVGTITDEIGTKPDALSAHTKALEIRRALADADPSDLTLRVDVAETLDAIGLLHRSLGRMTDCHESFAEARASLEPVVATHPDRTDALFQLARACSDGGAARKISEQWDQAGALYSRAREIFGRLVKIDPDEPKYLRNLAWSTYQMGNLVSDRRRKAIDSERAKADYAAALGLQRKLIAAHPGEPDYPIDMAQCYISLGNLAGREGNLPASIGYLEDALKLQKEVVASHATVTVYLSDLAETCFNLGYANSQFSRPDDALRWYRESIDVADRLARLDPANLDYQDGLGRTVNNLGYILLEQGSNDEALSAFLRAIDIHRRVLAKAPEVPMHRSPLVHSLLNLSRVKIARRKPAEAVAAALEARSLADGFPEFLIDIASRLSMAAGLLETGRADRDRYLDLAMETIRLAISSGAPPTAGIQTDRDFVPLWPRKDFQALVYDPTFPADPFAR